MEGVGVNIPRLFFLVFFLNTHSFPTLQMWFTVSRYLCLQAIRELVSSDVHYHKQSHAQYLSGTQECAIITYTCVLVNWKTHRTCNGEVRSLISFRVYFCHEIFAAACDNCCPSAHCCEIHQKEKTKLALWSRRCTRCLSLMKRKWRVHQSQCQMRPTAALYGCCPPPTDAH